MEIIQRLGNIANLKSFSVSKIAINEKPTKSAAETRIPRLEKAVSPTHQLLSRNFPASTGALRWPSQQ